MTPSPPPSPFPLRVIFCGTPEFSVPTLQALLDAPDTFNVLGVLTQPDRPSGRGQKLTPPPVKVVAQAAGLTIHQPQRLRKTPEVIAWLKDQQPDFLVTAAFGQILSQEVLDIPRLGTVNVHASLLPEYRGPNPIQWAVLDGKTYTGITTMLTDIGVDTGDMLATTTVEIGRNESADSLTLRMATAGATLLTQTLLDFAAGQLQPITQDAALATHAPKLAKTDAWLDWAKPALTLHRQIRGQQPWPGALASYQGQSLKLISALLAEEISLELPVPAESTAASGTLLRVDTHGLWVQTGQGILVLSQLQPPGKRPMSALDWSRGTLQQFPTASWWPPEEQPRFDLSPLATSA
jgi:methionyl-tRNA formyltransferase